MKKYITIKNIILATLLKLIISAVVFFVFFAAGNAHAAYGFDSTHRQVKARNSSTVYYLDHARGKKKAYVSEESFYLYGNKLSDIKIVSQAELNEWPDVNLVKTKNSNSVYYINGNKKTLIRSERDFKNFGFKDEDIFIIKNEDLNNYELADYYRAGLVYKIVKNKTQNGKVGGMIAVNAKSSVYIYPDKSSQIADFIKGEKNINIATFDVDVSAGEDIDINSIILSSQGRGLRDIKYENGFSNLRVYVRGSKIGKTIAKPSGGDYLFGGDKIHADENMTIEVKVYVDTKNDLKTSEAKITISGLGATGHDTNAPVTIKTADDNNITVNFDALSARITAIAGGQAGIGQKNNLIGSFRIENLNQETLRLDSIIVRFSEANISSGLGYRNLRIFSRLDNHTVGTKSNPVAGANRIYLGGYQISTVDKEAVFDVYVDASEDVPAGDFQISFSDLRAQGKDSHVYASDISGQPTEGAYVSVSMNPKVIETGEVVANKDIDNDNTSALSWPTGSHKINYYYHDQNYPFSGIGPHNGVDINVSQGSVVKAAGNGTIVSVYNGGSTDASYVIVKHNNSLKTVYGHLSDIVVHEGDSMTKGQEIGLSGGTPGTNGAGPQTTGPHLHFEVLLNGQTVDPMDYL